jgi:hypothetical protein
MIDLKHRAKCKESRMQAVVSLTVPVLRYSFGIINWHQGELQRLDRKTRKMLTIHGHIINRL